MNKTQARKEIVAEVRQYFNEIVQEVANAPEGKVIAEVEDMVRDRAHRLFARILELAVEQRAGKNKLPRPPICDCGHKMRNVGKVAKRFVSIVGDLTFDRVYYYCDHCRKKHIPFDEEMGFMHSFTDGARKLMTLCGALHSFEVAGQVLKTVGGLQVSSGTVRTVTEKVAADIRQLQEENKMVGEEAPKHFDKAARAYCTMDGTMANTRERDWVEVKLGAFYDHPKSIQHYVATTQPASDFGPMMRGHAAATHLGKATEIVAGGDGAAWIWNLMQANFPMAKYQFLDFYHMAAKVHATANAIYGEGSAKGKRWTGHKLKAARHRGGKGLLQTLRRAAKQAKNTKHREALDALINYIAKHVGRMDYPLLKSLGIDIGTGPQESACKNVIGKRLKGTGMRWCIINLEGMARLRALAHDLANWNRIWEQYKLYKTYAAAA